MRYVTIEKVEPGMILAKSVFDEADRVLLGAASVMTTDFIEKANNSWISGTLY